MHGTVVDPSGRPVPGATVSAVALEPEPGSTSRYRSKVDPRYIVTSDAEGNFQIDEERHFEFYFVFVPPEDHWRPHGVLQAKSGAGVSVRREFAGEMGYFRFIWEHPSNSVDMGTLPLTSSAAQ